MSSMCTAGTAIVTGSARGIGRAIALRLVSDGYNIVLSDLPSKQDLLQSVHEEIQKLGGQSHVVLCDVTVEKDVEALVESAAQKFGSVNVMVANAGVYKSQPTQEIVTADWDLVFSVNVRGVMLCLKHAGKQMIKQGKGGRIVAACSIAGKKGNSGAITYCASKFAVRGMVQAAACDLGKYNITVNAYAPGVVGTEMIHNLAETFDTDYDGVMAIWKNASALGTNGTPEDVAGLVSFLVSPNARFISGQSYIIDGGTVFD